MNANQQRAFYDGLSELILSTGIDHRINSPTDSIIQYVILCLDALERHNEERDRWMDEGRERIGE